MFRPPRTPWYDRRMDTATIAELHRLIDTLTEEQAAIVLDGIRRRRAFKAAAALPIGDRPQPVA